MINTFVKEFLAVSEYLLKSGKAFQKGYYLFADRSDLTGLLNRNPYETAEKKLIVWRSLRWIAADDNHFTSRVKIDGKTVRRIKIDMSVHKMLTMLSQKQAVIFSRTHRAE
jgi:hypothetical protein